MLARIDQLSKQVQAHSQDLTRLNQNIDDQAVNLDLQRRKRALAKLYQDMQIDIPL
jgi:hypothetical protein